MRADCCRTGVRGDRFTTGLSAISYITISYITGVSAVRFKIDIRTDRFSTGFRSHCLFTGDLTGL